MSGTWSRRTLLAAGVLLVVGAPTAAVLAGGTGDTTDPDDTADTGPTTASTDPSAATDASVADRPATSAPAGGSTTPSRSPDRQTAEVQRRDLVRTYEASGSVGFGDRTAVAVASGGTITDLPLVGSVVDVGAPICEIDGAPGPILLVGQRPMWRELRSGVDPGMDITQLELNMVLLGHADPEVMALDTEWDRETTAAVKRWQASLGRDETGRVARTDVWYRPTGAVRVASHTAVIGGDAMGEILEVTGVRRFVRVDLDADRSDLADVDADVDVELADGSTVTGTIIHVADVATPPSDPSQSATVEVQISLPDDVDVPDESPVRVQLVENQRLDVLAVPVETVVALAEGGYALEVIGDGGSTHLVAVDLGRFADGWVEVEGDIEEGQQVVSA